MARHETDQACAQGSNYNALDHAEQILKKCVALYSCEQMQAVAVALRQWNDKWIAAIDLMAAEGGRAQAAEGEVARLKAEIDMAQGEIEHILGGPRQTLMDAVQDWKAHCADAERDKLRQLIKDIDISDLMKHDLLLCDVDMGKPCACGLIQLQDRINEAMGAGDG